jgi:hypothetical protein
MRLQFAFKELDAIPQFKGAKLGRSTSCESKCLR